MAIAIQHRKVSYTLELDDAEANALFDVCMCIGGTAQTRRGIFNEIKNALANAGVTGIGNDDIDSQRSAIYFTVKT